MAFQRPQHSFLFDLLATARLSHWEERAVVENFVLEERLTEAREDSYAQHVSAPADFGEWRFAHENYLSTRIRTAVPETFADLNDANWLPHLDPDQFLLRVENLSQLLKLAHHDDNDLMPLYDHLHKLVANRNEHDAQQVVAEFLGDCNRARDHRPLFVGFWGEVKDLFEPEQPDWPERLRDRFGLGHLDPMSGEPIPILVLRYRLRDVLAARTQDRNIAAVPTVLDGSFSPFFCPTPQTLDKGQTVDLSPGTMNDYRLICEILHRFIAYEPAFVYRVGLIAASPGKTGEEARGIHVQYLQDDFKNFSLL